MVYLSLRPPAFILLLCTFLPGYIMINRSHVRYANAIHIFRRILLADETRIVSNLRKAAP